MNYAVKIISLRMNDSEDFVKQEIFFLEKFYLLSNCPKSFPKYLGYVKETSSLKQVTYNIYFDYYPIDMREKIKKNLFVTDFSNFIEILKDLISALAFLQTHKITHRDIKPENIQFDEKNQIILSDFGIAKIQKDFDEPIEFCGAENYKSPEWSEAESKNLQQIKINCFKSDVYSLGLVMLEICGIPIDFPNKSLLELKTNIDEMIASFYQKFKTSFIQNNDYLKIFEIMKSMLNFDCSSRPDFLDLFKNFVNFDENASKLKIHFFIQNLDTADFLRKQS